MTPSTHRTRQEKPAIAAIAPCGTAASRSSPAGELSERSVIEQMRRPLAAPRVLVAEDDREMRRLIAATLRHDGLDVVEACDGAELFAAVEAAVHAGGRKGPPLSLIVSDVRMPGLSGLDVLRILRAGYWFVPVILITAFSDATTRREARGLEAWAVLDKPFPLEDLRTLVQQALAAHGALAWRR